MTIHLSPILSRVTSFEEFTVGTTSFRAPVLDTRNFSTLINAKNAETVVLGGLITQGEEKERRSIPFFGDIPFLGELAGSRIKKDERSELVVILTPTIETLTP